MVLRWTRMDVRCQSLLGTLFLHHRLQKEGLQKNCQGLRKVAKIKRARRRAQKEEVEQVAGVISDIFLVLL